MNEDPNVDIPSPTFGSLLVVEREVWSEETLTGIRKRGPSTWDLVARIATTNSNAEFTIGAGFPKPEDALIFLKKMDIPFVRLDGTFIEKAAEPKA